MKANIDTVDLIHNKQQLINCTEEEDRRKKHNKMLSGSVQGRRRRRRRSDGFGGSNKASLEPQSWKLLLRCSFWVETSNALHMLHGGHTPNQWCHFRCFPSDFTCSQKTVEGDLESLICLFMFSHARGGLLNVSPLCVTTLALKTVKLTSFQMRTTEMRWRCIIMWAMSAEWGLDIVESFTHVAHLSDAFSLSGNPQWGDWVCRTSRRAPP